MEITVVCDHMPILNYYLKHYKYYKIFREQRFSFRVLIF